MNLFSAGQKISLYFEKDKSLIEMFCVIEAVENDRLILNPPQYFMRYVDHLQSGCELTAKVFTKLGTIDFNTIVISSPLEEYFSIELDYNALKLTNGEELPVIDAVEKLTVSVKGKEYKFKTFEISSEYIKFVSNEKLEINQTIDCILTLPQDYGIIKFRAIISEIDQVYENEYKADYITISETDKQNILYYMYMYVSG